MSGMTNWHESTAVELGAGIGEGRIDPVELAEHFVARIEANDADQTVYIARLFERTRNDAKAAAKRAKEGARAGPLDGVPVCWKDCFDLAGLSSTNGSKTLSHRIAAQDAALISRGAAAGLVMLGKTNLSEFCYSGLGINPAFGTPVNACDDTVERVPGGSSSGTAVAVASGLAACGVGTDTGGSVRIPAAWNGLVGLKTTFGLLPGDGLLNLSPKLDTAGPLVKSVADAGAMLAVMAARPGAELAGASLVGVRLGVPTATLWDDLGPGIETAARGALDQCARAGARLVPIEMPEHADLREMLSDVGTPLASDAWGEWGEHVSAHHELVYEPVLRRLEVGKTLSTADAERVRTRAGELAESLCDKMARVDAVAYPTVCAAPPPIAELIAGGAPYDEANGRASHNTRFANFFGLCALTLPCGRDELGMPVGLQLSGLPFAEDRLLRVAKAVEDCLAAQA